jgi:hypothetical protein
MKTEPTNAICASVDFQLFRAGFSVGSYPDKHAFPANVIENVKYVHLDVDRLQEDDRTRPHQIAIGVAERGLNVQYIYDLVLGRIEPPKEIWLYSELKSGRVVAKRILTDIKMRSSNTSYTNLPGGERELLVHRLVFSCFLHDAEYPKING